ncbi:MAG: ABC transporter substrate-binding protein [Actinomycetota bacterium]|nr:ABC transporter substrate-binding protein [Actinomycetota bacterium]
MRGTRLWLAIALIASLFATAIVAGCGDDDDEATTDEPTAGAPDLETLEEGKLSVGTDAPFEPFEIGQPGDPDFGGYDIDVMNAIAEELGLEAEYTNTGFNAIFRDTANGLFDTAAAASTITEEREAVVDFTDPYYEAQQALLVPEGSDIASVEDLGGVIVGAQDGTTGEAYAEDETDAQEVRGFPQGPDAVSALITGQVEAVIIDQPVAADAIEKQGGVEIAEEIATNELYGFAIAPDNDGLREAMNEALATLKEDGTLESLYDEYFSTAPPESVISGTNELLTDE